MQKINILVWTLDVTITAPLARGSPRDFYQLLKSIQILTKIIKISIAKSPLTLPSIFLFCSVLRSRSWNLKAAPVLKGLEQWKKKLMFISVSRSAIFNKLWVKKITGTWGLEQT